MTDLTAASWMRTAVTAALLPALFAMALALASTLGPLRHTGFPGHPYPPPGYVRNPFSSDPGDLLSSADVARVRADLLGDGDVELRAFATGDGSQLARADAGDRLARLRQLVANNEFSGIIQQEQDSRSSLVVGRLRDSRDPSVTWCAQERGITTLIDVAKAGGQRLQTRRYRFEGRFWLARFGDRYLITDADVVNQSLPDGE